MDQKLGNPSIRSKGIFVAVGGQPDIPNVPPKLTAVGMTSASSAWAELAAGDATAASLRDGEMRSVFQTEAA